MTAERSRNVSNSADTRLELRFLGAPQVRLNGEPVPFRSRKVLALLVYLAVEGGLHRRERLVDLLWPESSGSRGSTTLRSTLSRLRDSLGHAAEVLETDSRGVQLVLHDRDRLDVAQLLAISDAAEVTAADADSLPEGRFLEGFSLDGSPEFDDWVGRWASACQGTSASLYHRLSEQALRHGRLEVAEDLASRWQLLAPFDDGPIAALVEVDARRGARASALDRFSRYADVLATELEAQPSSELRSLVDRVRAGDLSSSSPQDAIRRHLDDGGAALNRGDAREAVVALDQAEALLWALGPSDVADLTLPVLETRARALELCGRFDRAQADYQRLIDRAEDEHALSWRLRGLVGLAVLHATPTVLTDYRRAAELAESALDLAHLLGDQEAEALARWAMLLEAHYGRGDEAAALDHATRGIAAARAIPDSSTLPRLLNDLHWVHAARGDLAAAGEALEEAIEGWERTDDHSMLADSLNGGVLLATLRGDFDNALATAARGTELARENRNLWNQLAINANLGLLRRERGHYDEAISALRAACDVAVHQMPVARVFYQLTLAIVLGDLGLGDRVEALCADVEAVEADLPGFWLVPETVTTVRLRNRLQAGTLTDADLDTLERIAGRPVGLSLTSVSAPAVACSAALHLGQPERALAMAARHLDAADQASVRLGQAEVLLHVASAHLDLGATHDAAAALDRATAAADGTGARRTRWLQHLVGARLQLAVGNEDLAATERAGYLDERAAILTQVPTPDRASFDAVIGAAADRALASDR